MAQSVGCKDLGVDCSFVLEVDEGNVEEVVSDTIKHARVAHPEFNQQLPELEGKIRSTVADLLRQSKYLEQS